MALDEVVVRNPSRRLIPAGISVATMVMFLPPLVLSIFESEESTKATLGAVGVTITALLFAYQAWKAPVEGRFTPAGLTLRSVKASHYELSQIRRWFFAVPVGLPTQNAPGTNALLHVTLADGVRFCGEVTREQAAALADWLPHVAITNALAD